MRIFRVWEETMLHCSGGWSLEQGLAGGLPGVDLRGINFFAGRARHHFYNLNGLN